MTLALYGKSRKRQGGLIFSAFMAIMVAAIGGVAMIGTAFAHHATITGTVTCQENGSYTVNWKVENSEDDKYMWIDSQTNPGVGTTTAVTPDPVTYNNGPDPAGIGTATTSNIPAGTASVTLTIGVHWTTNANDTGNRVPSSGSTSYSKQIDPSAVCGATIHIKKNVRNESDNTTFTADVNNAQGAEGDASNLTFSENSPRTHSFTPDAAGTDDYTVTEDALAGYVVTGKYITTGDANCPSSDSGSWVTSSPATASGGALDNIGHGDEVTVCFRNERRAQLWVKKVVAGAGADPNQSFTANIENLDGSSGENAAAGFSQTTPYSQTWDENGDDFRLTEVSLPANWAATATKILSGANQSCDSTAAAWDTATPTIADGSFLNNIDNGDAVTVCFKNTYTPPVVPDPTFVKVKENTSYDATYAYWAIAIHNNQPGAVAQSGLVVTDVTYPTASAHAISPPGACTPGSGTGPWTCSVTAGGTTTIRIRVALTATTGSICTGRELDNVATVVTATGAQLSQTPGGAPDLDHISIPATADASCITVEKSNGVANGNKVDWTVTFHNSGPPATIDMSDSYQDAGTGTNLDNPNLTCTLDGSDAVEDCEVAVATGNTTVTLHTDRPAAECEDQTVSNTVDAYFNGTRLGTTGNGRTGTYTEKGNPALCNNIIRLCKVWAFDTLNEISDGTANFTFDVNGTFVNINNVTEGNLTPACILLEVANGLVNISEQLTAGFTAEGWTINNPASSGSGGTVEFELSSDGCYDTEEQLVGTLVGLVRQAISVVTVVTEGDPICTVTFRNHDDQNNEPTGAIRVEKYLDINGDGDANDTGEGLIPGWDVTIAGPVVNGTFDLADGTYSWLGLETGDVYMLTEATVAGYTVTNATVNGVTIGASTFAGAAVPNGGFTIVRFYNKPQGSIIVHKVAVTRQGFGPETDAPNDDDGWTITVSSAQCGINISKQTDANGNAVFAGLPLCTDYVVSENPVNAASPGFNPVSPVSVSGQTPNGQTITFKNRKDAEDPRCTVNCGPSTATPTSPTTPPTTVVPPTTPIPPVIPPVTQVAGEKTPGASATPIAPSTGGGIIGGATGGTNLVLVIAGILALTSGLSFVALGRKSRR